MSKSIYSLIFFAFIEFLFFFLLKKTNPKSKPVIRVLAILSIVSYTFLGYQIAVFDRVAGVTHSFYWALGFMLLHLIPKLVAILFWTPSLVFLLFLNRNAETAAKEGRRKFVGQLGLGLAAIPFAGIIHGMWKGKYNFRVLKHQLVFEDLPEAFDGFKILQISDLHSGSFDNAEKIKYAVDLINEQQADLFLFTGDIVNTKASEFHPWVDTFKGLKNFEYGKFSVLGNHDYGEYVKWPSEAAKEKNFHDIKELHQLVDFTLLCNENRTITKGKDSIKLIGVENWGKNFKQAGDLEKASTDIKPEDFKVLMSHDPSHWEYEIKNHPNNYQLTLSGHTHGLQFGIEIPGWLKWSPAQYIYKQWAGLYKHASRYVYVNRGFGFHAFPGRVGIWPEVTVLELTKKPIG